MCFCVEFCLLPHLFLKCETQEVFDLAHASLLNQSINVSVWGPVHCLSYSVSISLYSTLSSCFVFLFLYQYSAEDKIMMVLCVGGPQCLLYYLLFRFNVMICYVWIRYRVSENMYLSVLHVKDGGPVDIFGFVVKLVLPIR